MTAPDPGDVLIVPTRAAADRLQRVIAAANAPCDSLADDLGVYALKVKQGGY